MELRPGLRLAGKYELTRRLGGGTFGEVWHATDTFRGRPAAIKFLRGSAATQQVVLDKFRAEARIGDRLDHPGIAKVHDFGEYEGDWYLVMEFLDGHDLAEELRAHPDGLPLTRLLPIGVQIAEALAEAHRLGVVHRDLKPANLMLLPGDQIRICDFGIAKFASTLSAETLQGIAGSPAYLSPEQCKAEPVDHRADLYALGCVLHELATGRRPFEADTLHAVLAQHVHATPKPPRTGTDGLDRLILHLLAKRPDDRPSDGTAVATRLRAIPIQPTATQVDPPAEPPATVKPPVVVQVNTASAAERTVAPPARPVPAVWKNRRRRVIGGALVVLLVLVGSVALMVREMRSGYHLLAVGGEVKLFRGHREKLFGWNPASPVPAADQPILSVEALPPAQQDRVRKGIALPSLQRAKREIVVLKDSICDYTIVAGLGITSIIRGAGQKGCELKVIRKDALGVPLPKVDARYLPETTLRRLSGPATAHYATLDHAVAALHQLEAVAKGCEVKPGVNGCPEP